MPLIVQKFGGTSVANAEKIRGAARRAIRAQQDGKQVVMVVSAMGHQTDVLVDLAKQITDDPSGREMDMLLSTGEQVSVALMAMAIHSLGAEAVSLTGGQIGIRTDSTHTKARIQSISTERMKKLLDDGKIVIAAGFQGIDEDFNITTLGRGGSDTTAVALAAVLGAQACEIYTDVAGVYSADPRVVPDARRLPRLSFDEALEMAATGSEVLALRSVEFARNYGVPVHVRSSFSWEPGTWVREEDPTMEQAIISGVTYDTTEAKVTIEQVPDRPGIAATVFRALAEGDVNVDMIVQNVSTAGHTDISFTVPSEELARTLSVMEKVTKDTDANGFSNDPGIGRVSLVGAGMRSNPGVAAKMFETLAGEQVNIEMISTSSIRISCVVQERDVERAVRALHKAFDLDRDTAGGEES